MVPATHSVSQSDEVRAEQRRRRHTMPSGKNLEVVTVPEAQEVELGSFSVMNVDQVDPVAS